jgi:phage terminase small subunit
MSDKLTQKQEAFALAYVEIGNASEAYRRAYYAENMQPQTVWVKASELLSNGNVAVRVMELQEAARERTLVTVESLCRELDADRELARDEKQASAAISAVMGKAKLHGLLIDKVQGKLAISHEEALEHLNRAGD